MMDIGGAALILAAMAAVPGAQKATAKPAAEATLPPGRPIPRPPVDASRVGKPVYKSGPEAEYPAAARAAGEHGKVVIAATVTADGKVENPRVATSSRATALDESALAAARATSFFPAKNADGIAIAAPVEIPFLFYEHRSRERGGGLVHYGCSAFVRDMDWWKVTWPEAGYQKDELYTMMLGLGVIGGMRAGGFDVAALKRGTGDFAKRWQAAIDRCRAKPDALFVDMIKPEGDYAKAMVAAMRDRPAGKAQ